MLDIERIIARYRRGKNGNRDRMKDPHGQTTYEWDRLHRLTKVTEPDTKWISYEYDWNNNRTKMTDHIEATSKDTLYEYNTRGFLWKLTDRNTGVTTYDYYDDGSLHTMEYPNGVVATYTYDPYRGWLTHLIHESGATTIAEFTYAYNPTYWGKNGTRTSMVEYIRKPDGNYIDSTVTYTYDNLYRLTGEVRTDDYSYNKAYTYDPNGNRETMTNGPTTYYHYDMASKLGDYGTVNTPGSLSNTNLTYDGAGNTEFTRPPGSAPVTTYTWNWDNKMTQVREGTTTLAQFAYDGDGIRTSAIVDSGITQFVHEGLLGELDGQGNFHAFYCTAPDGMISRLSAAGPMYYHGDGLWSVGAVTTATPVSVSNAYSYDAWGNRLTDLGGAWQPYQYVGRMSYYTHDQESGLRILQLGARYYDPAIGRFISRDPIEYQGGMNLYAYVAGRPTAFVDPLGLSNQTIGPAPPPEWPSIRRPSPPLPPPNIDYPGCMMFCIPVMIGPFLAPCLTCALLPPPANAICAGLCLIAMTGATVLACDRACSCPFEPIPNPDYQPPRTPRPLPGFGGRPLPPVVVPPQPQNPPPWY